MKTGLYIGRFQPFHEGHKKMVNKILEECDTCVILVRNGIRNSYNPFGYFKRSWMIRWALKDLDYWGRIAIRPIPDYDYDMTVYYGRKVGWDFKEIRLDKETENISATKIRHDNSNNR